MQSLLKHFILITIITACNSQGLQSQSQLQEHAIQVGAERTEIYFPLLKNKRVAVTGNHTSLIGAKHLVDSLLRAGIDVVKVFSPEHGFRGNADAGELIDNRIDLVTGLPIVSLYGNRKKPLPEDLADVEVVVFDIQDVGTRFYTYISTMTLVMEACAEKDIPVVILDRPNPNGFFIDGPVLKPGFESFVGMHPVPVVHGMTVGEYAMMVNGQFWLADSLQCNLIIVKVENWDRSAIYELPVRPSPNLPNKNAVYLYPSLCFFEGTAVSVGRGTDWPFQITGHPAYDIGGFCFTPRSIPGAAKNPPFEGEKCFGINHTAFAENPDNHPKQLHLQWLIDYYQNLKDKTRFFNNYFPKLAGNSDLQKQIEAGLTEEEIRESWQADLDVFKSIRRQYLLYPDFE
jgi:uncharacterized protein YbbC (DUF1343 family)